MTGVLVLITGAGRSGTSAMAGTLHHLGLSVPGPYLGANTSNPRGFFESSWSVAFHNELTKRAGIGIVDSRPGALARVQAAITPQTRSRLEAFLIEKAEQGNQIVVKDPRTVWSQRLWNETAQQVGLELRCITMLRHPCEVAGSRSTYYGRANDAETRRRDSILNVARWTNTSLISERETRGLVRAFVRYTDLLQDWRAVTTRVGDELGLRYPNASGGRPLEAVDDFIDPSLRRHEMTWADLDIPESLQAVAQGAWDELNLLADVAGGTDTAVSSSLDRLSRGFGRLLADAEAISGDTIWAAANQVRTELASTKGTEQESLGRRPPAAPGLRDASGRELVEELGRRAERQLRRRVRGVRRRWRHRPAKRSQPHDQANSAQA